jgi:hypothetical protein
VPGIARHPLKKINADETMLLGLLRRWQDEAAKCLSDNRLNDLSDLCFSGRPEIEGCRCGPTRTALATTAASFATRVT